MLQRLTRTLLPVCLKTATSDTRMSQGRERIARAATRRQHTEPVSSAAKVAFEPGSHLRAEARAEPQPAVTDSISFKHVKQEASTAGTEAVHFVSTERPGKLPRARKRKQPEAPDHSSEPDASYVSAQTAAATDGKQHVTASSSRKTVCSPQRRTKAAVKGKTVDVILLADAADVVQQASLDVAEPVSKPAKSSKQQKPRAKAVIKSELAAETEPTGAAASAQQAEPSKDSATIADTSLGKPRKQRKLKAVVKTETVVVKEDLASPDASAAALSDESAKKSKPCKPRAKKVLTVEQLLESVDVVPYRERVMPKKWVGAHVSMGGGLERAVVRAASIGDVHGLKAAVLCCAWLCCAVLCFAVLCCAVLCCAVLCCAVLCCAVLSLPATRGRATLCPGVICMFCLSVLIQVEITCSLVFLCVHCQCCCFPLQC